MKKAFTIFLVLLIAGLMTALFFMSLEIKDNIRVGANLVSTLASLVTLFIAVLLYSKYGLEKTVHTKQAFGCKCGA